MNSVRSRKILKSYNSGYKILIKLKVRDSIFEISYVVTLVNFDVEGWFDSLLDRAAYYRKTSSNFKHSQLFGNASLWISTITMTFPFRYSKNINTSICKNLLLKHPKKTNFWILNLKMKLYPVGKILPNLLDCFEKTLLQPRGE